MRKQNFNRRLRRREPSSTQLNQYSTNKNELLAVHFSSISFEILASAPRYVTDDSIVTHFSDSGTYLKNLFQRCLLFNCLNLAHCLRSVFFLLLSSFD